MEWDLILAGVPDFLEYLALALALLAVFAVIYLRVTPHDELKLIRSGNNAAALSLGGAVLGFVLPLAIVIVHHATVLQVVFWGAVALVVQIAAFFFARLIVPGLPHSIETGNTAAGAAAGLVSLAIGILNAACQIE